MTGNQVRALNPKQTRLSLQNRLVPAIAAISLILYLLDPYRGWLTLLIAFGGAVLFSYLWVRSLGRHLELVHERRYSWSQVGDVIQERFSLRNPGWLPAIWVEIDYASSMPGYNPNRVVSVSGFNEFRWETRGVCARRGLFTLGPVHLRTGDPLGIFRLERTLSATTTVLVTPPTIPLPKIDISPGGRAGDGRARRRAFETSVSISNVRAYIPGDSIRMIHWPTTARLDDYFVRVLESTPASDWWIFLDLDERALAGEGEETTEEHGVVLAASLVDHGLRAGQAVGLVTQAGGLAWHPPRTGEAHRHAMVRTLALAASGPISLGALIRQARPHFRLSPSLIVITASTSPDWIPDIQPLVQRRVIPTVILIDPESYAGERAGREQTRQAVSRLGSLGITHAVLEAQNFDRPELKPGTQGRWVWQQTRSSRAVAAVRPTDLPWRRV